MRVFIPDIPNVFLNTEIGGPNGTRTRVFGVRGRCPRPLDDGTYQGMICVHHYPLTILG